MPTTRHRLKRRFKTARAAWSDISKKDNINMKRIIRYAHTASRWRWVIR